MSHPSPVSVSANVDTFLRSVDQSAMRTNIGFPDSKSNPKVFYVEPGSGNDTTGTGKFGNPVATAQKAFDLALASGVHALIHIGVGAAGNIDASASGWPETIALAGRGRYVSTMGSITLGSIGSTIRTDGNLTIANINMRGATGSTPGTLTLINVVCNFVESNGGIGSTGASGANNEEGFGGDGEAGGNGGDGGLITVYDSRIAQIYCVGGDGGPGGGGGSGPDGSGNAGAAGNPGLNGNIYAVFSTFGTVTCATFTAACSTWSNDYSTNPIGLGGNAAGVTFYW